MTKKIFSKLITAILLMALFFTPVFSNYTVNALGKNKNDYVSNEPDGVELTLQTLDIDSCSLNAAVKNSSDNAEELSIYLFENGKKLTSDISLWPEILNVPIKDIIVNNSENKANFIKDDGTEFNMSYEINSNEIACKIPANTSGVFSLNISNIKKRNVTIVPVMGNSDEKMPYEPAYINKDFFSNAIASDKTFIAKYTFVSETLSSDATFDSVFSSGKYVDNFTLYSELPVYIVDDNTYMIKADPPYNNEFSKADPYDVCFARCNNKGEVLDKGIKWNNKTKTAYIDKGILDKKNDDDFADMQMQLLLPCGGNEKEISIDLNINNDYSLINVPDNAEKVKFKAYDMPRIHLATKETIKNISRHEIGIYINDCPYPLNDSQYELDDEGYITINTPAALMDKIVIDVVKQETQLLVNCPNFVHDGWTASSFGANQWAYLNPDVNMSDLSVGDKRNIKLYIDKSEQNLNYDWMWYDDEFKDKFNYGYVYPVCVPRNMFNRDMTFYKDKQCKTYTLGIKGGYRYEDLYELYNQPLKGYCVHISKRKKESSAVEYSGWVSLKNIDRSNKDYTSYIFTFQTNDALVSGGEDGDQALANAFMYRQYKKEIKEVPMEMEVYKEWIDGDNYDKKRPDSIKVGLYWKEDGKPDSDYDKNGHCCATAVLSNKNNWYYKFTKNNTNGDLVRKDKHGIFYEWTIKEITKCAGYKSSANWTGGYGSGWKVHIVNELDPMYVSIETQKKWEGPVDYPDLPDELKFALDYRKWNKDGTYGNWVNEYKTKIGKKSNNYKVSFNNELYYKDGVWWDYRIRELSTGNWITSVSPSHISGQGNKTVIITNKVPVPTEIEVQKVWANDNPKKRPGAIKVGLYWKEEGRPDSDYDKNGHCSATVELNEGNKWHYVFTYNNTNGNLVREDKDGKIYDWNIKEIGTPSGYTCSWSWKGNYSSGWIGTLTNTYIEKEGYIKLKKSSSSPSLTKENNEYSLKGAEYTVYNDSTCKNEVGKLITDEYGETNTLILEPGTYYVKETKAPKGYKKDENIYKVVVKENSTKINPCLLQVKDEPVTTPPPDLPPDPTPDLPPDLPPDPTPDLPPKEPEKGFIKLIKESAQKNITDNNPKYSLEGAEYGVYKNKYTKKQSAILTTDKNGISNVVELDPGTYYVKEIKAPKGYKKDKNTYTVVVTKNSTAINPCLLQVKDEPEMTTPPDLPPDPTPDPTPDPPHEEPEKGFIKLVKESAQKNITDNNPKYSLEGAEYGVYKNKYTKKQSTILITDKNGVSNVAELDPGTYYVKEIKAPKGYKKDKNTYTVVVTKNSTKTNPCLLQVKDEPDTPPTYTSGKITVIKKLENKDICIPGVEFTHVKPDGSEEKAVTDRNGSAQFLNLENGIHSIYESGHPFDLKINNSKISFSVENGIISPVNNKSDINNNILFDIVDNNGLITVFDKPNNFNLNLIKINDTNIKLKGAEFTIYDDDGLKNIIETDTTNDEGIIEFNNLELNKIYYLKETKVPEGYRIPLDQNGNEKIYKIELRDDFISHKGFGLYVDGSYVNEKAPKENVNVNKDNNISASIVIENKTLKELPETGTTEGINIFLTGLFIMMLAFILRNKNIN